MTDSGRMTIWGRSWGDVLTENTFAAIQSRRSCANRRRCESADAVILEHAAERLAELAVAIEDQEPLLSQESVDAVGQVPGDLFHDIVVRVRRAADDRHGARRAIDDEERVVGRGPARCLDLGREEVAGRDRRSAGAQELSPRRPLRSLRSGVDPVLPQDLFDRVRRDDVVEAFQRTL
jgi:hypothetical protein